MDERMVLNLISTIQLISNNLDIAPHTWRDQLQAVRGTTSSLVFQDTIPDVNRKRWQLPLVQVFQRVAFADADHGFVQDVADWCLRQSLHLLSIYPNDVDLLALIGDNWLHRAQKSLANISRLEQNSSSSEGSITKPHTVLNKSINSADYVEARALLLPAVEYFQRAAEARPAQSASAGYILCKAAEALMSLGNVTAPRSNGRYYREAMEYLRETAQLSGFTLPQHLASYLEEYGSLYP